MGPAIRLVSGASGPNSIAMTAPTSCDPLRFAEYVLAGVFLGCLCPRIASAEGPRLPADIQSSDGTWQIALAEARSDVGPVAPLPKEFSAEMDSLGIVDSP